jgi:serine/threonine protein kinase
VRWAAPEILDKRQPVSKESDVYSFAMVVIEVWTRNLTLITYTSHRQKAFTGKAPFYDSTATTAAVNVLSGNRPERPTHPSLTDNLWDLTEHCWNHDPRRRLEISEVVLRLRATSTPQRDDGPTPDGATLVGVRQTELSSGESNFVPLDEVVLSKVRRVTLPTIPINTCASQTPTAFETWKVLHRIPTCPRRDPNPPH